MSIGLGLFLGLGLASVTVLFVATKDRWRWKRILLWLFAIVIGLPALGVGVYFIWERVPKRIVPSSELWDIALGMPKKEVLFRKGPPADSTSAVYGDGQVNEAWVYHEEYAPSYTIHFERDSVEFIEADETRGGGSLPSVGGLTGYESQEDVVRKLGEPVAVSTSADGQSRILSFARRRLFVVLVRNEVSGIGIYRPSSSRGSIHWRDEDSTLSR